MVKMCNNTFEYSCQSEARFGKKTYKYHAKSVRNVNKNKKKRKNK